MVGLRRRPCRKDRKVRRHILSGRQPVFWSLLLSSRPEAAGNRGLVHGDDAFARSFPTARGARAAARASLSSKEHAQYSLCEHDRMSTTSVANPTRLIK